MKGNSSAEVVLTWGEAWAASRRRAQQVGKAARGRLHRGPYRGSAPRVISVGLPLEA